MSIHAYNPEIQIHLNKQKKLATLSSLLIALLLTTLIGIALYIVTITLAEKNHSSPIYPGFSELKEELQVKKITHKLKPNPTAPTNTKARVIATANMTPIAIPVFTLEHPTVSVEFGHSDAGLGSGWGTSAAASPSTAAESGATFFGQEVEAERIVYVIDFSLSMWNDGRQTLMREELVKSLKTIPNGTKYQLIYFAGPAWFAGSEVEFDNGENGHEGALSAEVKLKRDQYRWSSDGSAMHWKVEGTRQKAD